MTEKAGLSPERVASYRRAVDQGDYVEVWSPDLRVLLDAYEEKTRAREEIASDETADLPPDVPFFGNDVDFRYVRHLRDLLGIPLVGASLTKAIVTLRRERDAWFEALTPARVQEWLDRRAYHSVASGGGGAVRIYDYEGEAGVIFERDSLAEACALADRFFAEVPCVDDVGEAVSERAVQEWFAKNDPSNIIVAKSRLTSGGMSGDSPSRRAT